MDSIAWPEIVILCLVGAMSPGPSLVVILREALTSGLSNGLYASIFHALGIGVWAGLTVFGLSAVIAAYPGFYVALSVAGAIYLAYLGVKLFLSKQSPIHANTAIAANEGLSKWESAKAGFLVALSNPKALIFFSALFAQYLKPDQDVSASALLVMLPIFIDGLWYCLVCMLVSTQLLRDSALKKMGMIDRFMGVLLVMLAGRVLYNLIGF